MKSMKTKLVAAVAMLIVAAVMMTSASFAWFTISTAPRVDNLEVRMAGTTNFEIAQITGDNETKGPKEPNVGDHSKGQGTWGAYVTFASADAIVFPAVMSNGGISTIQYEDDGRVADALTKCAITKFASGTAVYYADITATTASVKNVSCAAVYGVWLRSNVSKHAIVSIGAFKVTTGGGASGSELYPVGNENHNRIMSAAAVRAEFYTTTVNPADGTVTVGSSPTVIEDGQQIELTANQLYQVRVTCYFDGDYLYAKDIADGLKLTDFDINFTIVEATNFHMGTDLDPTQEDETTHKTVPLMNF